MELFHLKTPYLDCPQCFFYNSRALSGTPYIGIAKQEPEGAEPLMDVTANLSDEVPLGCIAVKDYSENTGLLAFLKSIGFITEVVEKRRSGYVDIPICRYDKAVTLFGDGDFGEDGAFFLPIHTRDLTRRICLHERHAEGLTDERDMNMTPGPCPSLYCDLELRNDPDNGHSYLGWNEAEKAYYITDWIGCIAEWLSKLGYHLDGKMFAVVEGGMSYYTITVDGDKVTSEEFIPDATYVDEFYACEESEDT